MTTSTLLLRLEGPAQGWGDAASRWDYRTTMPRPTKSGTLGLLANALGRDYTDPTEDLAALQFGVRADRPGHIEYDFRVAGGGTFPLDSRTAQDNPRLSSDAMGHINYGPPRPSKDNAWTEAGRDGIRRPSTFIADAAFVVSFTGPTPLLEQGAAALERPARLLSLGRRAHPPSHPILHALLDGDRHDDWAETVALLPTSTTTTTDTWAETRRPTPDAVVSYEQPSARRGGGHGPILLTHATVQPPVPADEETAA